MSTRTNPFNAIVNYSVWSGCDVDKKSFEAGLWALQVPADLKDIPTKRFERTKAGVRKFFQWVDGLMEQWTQEEQVVPLRIVMESTGRYSAELAVLMIAQRPQCAPSIINPKTTSRYSESVKCENKTDRTAARALTCYGIERKPSPYVPPTREQAEIRDLLRYRYKLVSMRSDLKKRSHEKFHARLIDSSQKRMISTLSKEIEKIEKRVKEVLKPMSALNEDIKLLKSVLGVGWLTALTVLVELGDLRRFARARQLTSMCGMNPRRKESGNFVADRTPITKAGNRHARRILYTAIMASVKKDSELNEFYLKKLAEGKNKRSAQVASMRKLLLVMRAVLISGKSYQRYYNKTHKNVNNSHSKLCITCE